MEMLEWAKREIEIACKKENPDRKDGEWDYGCACYESAYKAFESLCGDGHSGFSIGITQGILNRLIDGKPLTAIEDTDDVWNCSFIDEKGVKHFQNSRMSSLFKDVYPDGTIKYEDIDRYIAVEVDSPDVGFRNGNIAKIIDEMFPITMPYYPQDKYYKVYVEEFLTDEKNGDFDTVGVLYLIKPDGEKVVIDRYFKESDDGMVEIDLKEFCQRELISKGFKETKE